jgi:hypothetical protein
MASRPVFCPSFGCNAFINEVSVDFTWFPGLSVAQKQRSITSLHDAARRRGLAPILEISSKSTEKLGLDLSAFHLLVATEHGEVPLENAFQSSKVFAGGGPYRDLMSVSPLEAKRDPRLRDSGALIAFDWESRPFPREPKTAFYDWLYLAAVARHRLGDALVVYAGFTDIEFNPERSINCQARSAALFVSLHRRGLIEGALASPEDFLATLDVAGSGQRRLL